MSDRGFNGEEGRISSEGDSSYPVPAYQGANPVAIDPKIQEEIVEYLEAEDTMASQEREPLEERVAKWRRQREQEPESASKDFPWKDASNVATPLAAMATNGNYAFLRQAFAMRNPFWTVSAPLNQEFAEHATAMTEFLQYQAMSRYHLNLNSVLETMLYVTASEGNCFVKVPWVVDNWQFKATDEMGQLRQVSKTMRDGPVIIPVPFEDFITRAAVENLQDAPWVRHRLYLYWHQLKQRQANLIYNNVDQIEDSYITKYSGIKEEDLARAGFDPKEMKMWDMREYHVFWDIDQDGVPEDVILTLNWDTKTVVRSQFNELGIRPWVNVPYEVRPHNLYKMGVGARSERLQDEVDTHRNYRVNGMVLANLRILVARRSAGISAKEKLYPGKILFADNPRDDVNVLQFGEVYPSSLEAEASAANYLKQITGLSDYSIGFNDPNVRYPTTSGMMYLGQQGSTVKGSVIEAIQNAMSEIGQIVVFQCVRNKSRINLDMFDQRRRGLIEEVLNMNVEDIPTRFQFSVKTTDINRTEDAKRQNLLTLTQLYAAYYKDITQTLMLAFNPQAQLPPTVQTVVMRHFTGASRMMEKVLKYFGEDETEKYLPDFRKAEMLLKALDAQQGGGGMGNGGVSGAMGPQSGGMPSVAGASGEPRMAGSAPASVDTASAVPEGGALGG